MAMQDNFVEIVIMAGFSSNGQQDSLAKYHNSCGYGACHLGDVQWQILWEEANTGGLQNLERVYK